MDKRGSASSMIDDEKSMISITSNVSRRPSAEEIALGLTYTDPTLINYEMRSSTPISSLLEQATKTKPVFTLNDLERALQEMTLTTPPRSTSSVLPTQPLTNTGLGPRPAFATCGHRTGQLFNQFNYDTRPLFLRTKFGSMGHSTGQLDLPHGFCLGRSDEVVIADTNNHRIAVFDKDGRIVFMFGLAGKTDGCLWYPRRVAILPLSGNFVVCDRGNGRSRLQIFSDAGFFIVSIDISYIYIVASLTAMTENVIVIADSVRPSINVIDLNTGMLLRKVDISTFVQEPSDFAIYGNEIFVCDFKVHTVYILSLSGEFHRKISIESICHFPSGIDVSADGDILIGDSHGNQYHVVVFDRNHCFLGRFAYPEYRVSRCWGLRLTSDGHLVTLAKNNHSALMFNTLFVAQKI